ncbi:antibiotic biosynthesis monooxygenase [Roseovarius rhodophyticola]|uniref:Antibiotic biosynthesis monooxygenase n=1 Tax=Roseovarius rhodophyticola TaxID=3080827 RepID=A0ABZ2TEH9_9RHOB|nr:antibiotic biosynthesis monooxygenase [Roseovarius sp. W115]MDV2931438.1 antibiotic biosynthesis monooxygenase [Roseovarius sp. W115]
MVVRNWEAAVGRADIDAWINTFRDRVLPNMQALDGFLDVTFLTKRDGDPCHVKVLTRWRNMAAITAFAGENPAKTVLPDFMAPFFKSYDAEATFYDEVLREEAND